MFSLKMKSSITVGLFILMIFCRARADDFLANSDFSNGASGWSGDSGDDAAIDHPFTNGTVTTGPAIPLHSDKAVRIYQRFRVSDPDVTFTIICTPSSNGTFAGVGKGSKVASGMEPEVERASLQDATGQWRSVYNINYRE